MKKMIFPVFLILSVLLSACGAQAGQPVTPTLAPDDSAVISEGHLVPLADVRLSFSARGTVLEILVKEGQPVNEGDVLVRLADREQAEASLAGAQLALTEAQQSYDDFVRAEGLSRAEAWDAYQKAQVARADAEKEWEKVDLDNIDDQVEDAEVDLKDKKDDLEDAQEEFDKYKDLDKENTRRKIAEDDLEQAQENYNDALRKLDEVKRERDTVRAAFEIAAENEAEALRVYNLRKDGLDADEKALLEARLNNAKAQVASAETSLANYDLKAPFAGTVTDINVSEGQLLGSDTWAVQMADFSAWYVETSDLTELEVVRITEGQLAQIVPDALSDGADALTLTGVVESISQSSKTQGGDVLYTVKIKLADADARLRWGMTVQVEFLADK